MRFPAIISLLSLFLFCSVLALPLAITESNDLSLTSRSDCEPGEICLVRRKKTIAAKANTAAKKKVWNDGKKDRAAVKKTAGQAVKTSKTSAQIKGDRKARKDTKVAAKKTRVDKAKANPNHAKKQDDRRLDKAAKQFKANLKNPDVKVAFHPGVAHHLDRLNIHGKDRKKVKKYHKGIVKNEMGTKDSLKDAKKAIVQSTAHAGGDNPNEPYHVTAKFLDDKGRAKTKPYKDEKGTMKEGQGHHIYTEKGKPGKGPAAYEKADSAISPADRASQQKAYSEKIAVKEKAAQDLRDKKAADKATKATNRKNQGQATWDAAAKDGPAKAASMTDEQKQAERTKRKEAEAIAKAQKKAEQEARRAGRAKKAGT